MRELKIAVITCSDTCSRGDREDASGKAIVDACADQGWDVVSYHVCPDDVECIIDSIIESVEVGKADVVFTTGGTGLGPRDVTPEATLAACDREIPGIAEAIRAESYRITKRAMLSRAVAAQRDDSLIINLPGSQKAVRETLDVVLDQLQHAVEMIAGQGHD